MLYQRRLRGQVGLSASYFELIFDLVVHMLVFKYNFLFCVPPKIHVTRAKEIENFNFTITSFECVLGDIQKKSCPLETIVAEVFCLEGTVFCIVLLLDSFHMQI